MAEQTWLESTQKLLENQTRRGLLHYADIAAALAEQDPERFAPAPRRVTPHFTVWRTLDEADDFEKVGGGWFAYHPWGAVGDEKLQLSSDGGKALRQAVTALKEAAGTTSSALDELLDDAEWRETEAQLREAALDKARAILSAGDLDGGRVADLLSEWSKCGGRKPGVVQKNRFAPAFIGIYVQKYREQVDLLNDWVEALREAVDDRAKVSSTLDTLWGRGDLAFAGTILPTTVLHTFNPEIWFPWTDTLARGLRSALDVGSGRADGSGEGYLIYCAGVRDYLDREGLSPHLADVALTRESLQASARVKKPRRQAEVGFGAEGFDLLAEIATTDGANAEWFTDRRVIYRDQVRLPLAALIERVAREVIQPVVNDAGLLGDDTVVVETKRVLARINAQSPRANGSMYYPYLWGAFFPTSQQKRQTASQLFLTIHPTGVDIGLALDSGPAEAQKRFETCVSGGDVAKRLQRWLATDGSILELRRFSLDGGPSIESTPVDSVADLKALTAPGGGWALACRLSSEEAREADVGDAVERATRALLPFFSINSGSQASSPRRNRTKQRRTTYSRSGTRWTSSRRTPTLRKPGCRRWRSPQRSTASGAAPPARSCSTGRPGRARPTSPNRSRCTWSTGTRSGWRWSSSTRRSRTNTWSRDTARGSRTVRSCSESRTASSRSSSPAFGRAASGTSSSWTR